MAERSSSWLETQPQSDGVERGPSWAALGQDKVTPARRPALNRSWETHLQGLGGPRGQMGACTCLAGDLPPFAGHPLEEVGCMLGVRAFCLLGSSNRRRAIQFRLR